MEKNDKNYSVKLRITLSDNVAMGPGKADLLENIKKTGSIAAAGREMGMSYKRAWDLVEMMNNCFKNQLVDKSKGGATGGGARLTETGEKILNHYRDLQKQAEIAIAQDIQKIFTEM